MSAFFVSVKMRNWKRRYFILDDKNLSYFKSDMVSLSLSLFLYTVRVQHTDAVQLEPIDLIC